MLTLVSPHREDRELLVAVEQMRSWWPGWERFLMGASAAFHGLIASALAFAPYDQIYNAGTAPVYDMASRYVWAVAFAVAAFGSFLLTRLQTTVRQIFMWAAVFPLGGLWLTAFLVAVVKGRGSAIGVAVWLVVYGIFAVAGLRIALGKR